MTDGDQNSDVVEEGTGDLLEPEPEDAEGLVIAVSRSVGAVARTLSNGMKTVSRAMTPRRRVVKATTKPELTQLLQQLGELVVSHAPDRFSSLEDREELWQLISQLARVQRERRLGRTPSRAARVMRRARRSSQQGAPAPSDTATTSETATAADAPATSKANDATASEGVKTPQTATAKAKTATAKAKTATATAKTTTAPETAKSDSVEHLSSQALVERAKHEET